MVLKKGIFVQLTIKIPPKKGSFGQYTQKSTNFVRDLPIFTFYINYFFTAAKVLNLMANRLIKIYPSN